MARSPSGGSERSSPRTAHRRRRVTQGDGAAGSRQLDGVAVHPEEQPGAGAHLDQDDGQLRPVRDGEREGRREVHAPVHLVGLGGVRGDDRPQLVLTVQDRTTHVGPRVAGRQAVAADDAGVPPGRRQVRFPEHEVVKRREPEDRAVLAGSGRQQQLGRGGVGRDGAAHRAVEGQLRVGRGELREPPLHRRQVRPGRCHALHASRPPWDQEPRPGPRGPVVYRVSRYPVVSRPEMSW